MRTHPFPNAAWRDSCDTLGEEPGDYRGIDDALVDSVTAADLRWTGQLLSRLSESQLLDAFRAGGYTADQSRRYVTKIRQKIAQTAAS